MAKGHHTFQGKRLWPLLAFGLLLPGVSCLKIKCIEGWTGFSESPSCYRFMDREETFVDAKLSCENYGSSLVIINTKAERDFLATTIGQMSGGQLSRNWWIGFQYNNETDPTAWLWLDKSNVDTSITPWADNFPGDSKSCGILNQKGKLESAVCEETKYYVCERPLGAPVICQDDWEHHEKSCYKRYHRDPRNYDDARSICNEQDSDLVIINSFAENKYIYDFANRDQVDVWLGIRENDTTGQFFWVDGTQSGGDGTVEVWEDNQPVSNHGLNAGFMAASSRDKWSTKLFVEQLGFVCEKGVGEFCQFETIGQASSCYDFDLLPSMEHDWESSNVKCSELGMHLVTVEDDTENVWVNTYLREAGLVDDLREVGLWIGYKETEKDSKVYSRVTDGATTDNTDVYKDFADYRGENPDEIDAVYLKVCPESANPCAKTWYANPATSTSKLYGCEFQKGTTLDVAGIMHPKVVCPEGWGEHFSGYCYLPVATEATWAEAEAYCKDNNTEAHLVSMLSDYENDFVRGLTTSLGGHIWFGLSDRFSDGKWIWSDGSALQFTQWNAGEPNGGIKENCGEIRGGGWNDYDCQLKVPFICKVKGKESGGPVIPDTSTSPPSPNCGFGSGWVEDPSTGMCYHFIEEQLRWLDARDECRLRGGYREQANLAAINSYQEQVFIHTFLTASGSGMQHWIGLNDFDSQNSYIWSDGTPVSYVNWADGEPNLEHEHCAEMIVGKGGVWNDAECYIYQPAICEKRGRNYIEPPKPEPPTPTCLPDWVLSMDRCYYFSESVSQTASNWTEAAAKCKSMHSGATLVSIRSQAEQDDIAGHVHQTAYIGATDVDVEDTWVWSDGSAWDFQFWGSDEPNGGAEENCLEMVPYYNGVWNDAHCDGSHSDYEKHFICAYDNVVCPQHWRLFDGSCWHSSNGEVASWQSARDVCKQSSSKADLASIHRNAEDLYVMDRVDQSGWVGLTRNAGDATFKWSDSSKFDYEGTWEENEPDNPDSQLCGSVSNTGGWASNACEQEMEFTCKLKSTHYYSCPAGWEKYGDYCYLINNEQLTWTDARDSCVNKGGNLASIFDIAEADFIKSISHYAQTCPDGWIVDNVLKSCYYVSPTDGLSWMESRDKCIEMGANLVEIRTEEKNKRLASLGMQIHSFWAGGSDETEEGVWKWVSDGSEFSYTNWYQGTGEPNGERNENCLVVWAETQGLFGHFAWNDSPCTDSFSNFICEKPFEDIDAPKKDKWIGLNDRSNPKTFAWSDDSYVFFTNWGVGMPNRHGDDNQACNYIKGSDNLWYHAECSNTLTSICKKPQDLTDIPPDVYGCSEGQIEYEASCYAFNYRWSDYATAQASCSEAGGNLLTINNEYEQAKIAAIVAEAREMFHIGLKFHETYQEFQWASGEDVSYTNWGQNQPDTSYEDDGSGKCVNIMDERALGYWFVSDCSKQHSFICEHPRQGFTTPPPPTTTTPKPEAKCYDYTWTKYNDHCYKWFSSNYYGGSAHLTFEGSRSFCQTQGGDLAVISDQAEMDAITSTGDSTVGWIGLQGFLGEGYHWIDDSPLDYVNWETNYPDTHGGVDMCIVADLNGAWINYNCDHLMAFVCEVVAGFEQPTTAPPPTDAPDIDCHDGETDGWIRRPDDEAYCYKIVTEEASWHEAKLKCEAEEGRLASIHTAKENTFLTVKMKTKSITEGWTGLTDLNADESLQWVDGSPTDFFYWAPNEPSNYQGLESCGTLYAFGGYDIFSKWNDANCGIKRPGYACKKPREGGWTTPAPTQPPKGHCAEGHAEFNGHCFLLKGLNEGDDGPVTWSEAQQKCKALGKGYDLVSIHSHNENAYLGAMLVDANTMDKPNYWIGLHSLSSRRTFLWSDESSADYFLWAANEPNSWAYSACIQMYGNDKGEELSKWDDTECENQLPYICHVKASPEHENPPPPPMCTEPSHADFVLFEGDCYFWMEEARPWHEAEEECKKKGAHLTSINDIGAQLYHYNAIQANDGWIGLSNTKDHKSYEWADGWSLEFSNWAEGSPVDSEEDVCITYNTTDGRWYPNPCNLNFPFMCRFSEKPLPTESPFGKCPEGYEDLGHEQFCYRIFDEDYSMTWDMAREQCLNWEGDLVSIHSEQENSMIHSFISSGYTATWIGLRLIDEVNYGWSDDTPFDGTSFWNTGEPNDPETEKCVEMLSYYGSWNDAPCDSYISHVAVCKAQKLITTTTTPAPHPTDPESSTTPHETSPHSTHPDSSTPRTTTTTTTTTRSTTTTKQHITPQLNSTGMSSGAIAGIVIMVLLTIAVSIGFFVMWRTRQEQMRKLFGLNRELNSFGGRRNANNSANASGFENLAYDANNSTQPNP